MAAIASQALAAKANVAGAKLSFKKNAARSVKAFSARAQAVLAPGASRCSPRPFLARRGRARARVRFGTREREILPVSLRRASNSSATARATRARGAGKGRGGESLPGTERGDARTADHARSLLSISRGARSGVARSPTPDFSAWRSRDSPRLLDRPRRSHAEPSSIPRRVCASRRVSPKPAVRSIPSSPPAEEYYLFSQSLRPSPLSSVSSGHRAGELHHIINSRRQGLEVLQREGRQGLQERG